MFKRYLAIPIVLLALGIPAFSAITGNVVDEDGKPIAKAKVIATTSDGKRPVNQTIYTDKNGTFSFMPTAKGENSVCLFTAVADGYTFGTGYYQSNERQDLTITLFPAQKLKGKIVDEAGKPLSGADITLNSFQAGNNSGKRCNYHNPSGIGSLGKIVSGKDGSFVLSHLPSPDSFSYGWVNINISKPGRAEIKKNIELKQLSEQVTITDPLECVLQGTLYLPGKTATAPEGLSIGVQFSDSEYGGEVRSASTDKNGRFVFKKLPPTKANVFLQMGNYRSGPDGRPLPPEPASWALPAVTDLQLSSAKETSLDLEMTPGALVKGIVTDKTSGKPIKDAELRIYHAGRPDNTLPDYIQSDENGAFAIRVPAGDVTVAVESIRDPNNYTYFQEGERPSVSFKVADGEEKSDVAIQVSPQENSQSMNDVQSKPVLNGLELTAGTYELLWDTDLSSQDINYNVKYQGDQAKSRIKKLPELISAKPIINAYRFDGAEDDGLLFVVLDESKGTDKGYDTAYIDVNRNSDLSDDQPVKWKVLGDNYQQLSPWLSVQSRQGQPGGDQTNNPIQVRLRTYKSGDYFSIQPERKGTWKGVIDSNKGKIECASIDSNSNGIYGNHMVVKDNLDYESGDWIFADTNGIGRVSTTDLNGPQGIVLNDVIALTGKLYTIQTNEVGNKITIAQYTGQSGTLLVQGKNIAGFNATASSLCITGKSGVYYSYDLSGKPITLPIGKYNISYCGLELSTKSKQNLNLTCEINNKTEIKPNELATADIGGDISVAINPSKKEMALKPGASETLGLVMKIGKNATVRGISSASGESLAPKVKFYNAKGDIVHTTTAGST